MGLQRFIELEPDLIVTDLVMPTMNGMELCKQVRAISDIPILVISALVEKNGRSAGLDAGADDHATKFIGRDDFVARVGFLLESS